MRQLKGEQCLLSLEDDQIRAWELTVFTAHGGIVTAMTCLVSRKILTYLKSYWKSWVFTGKV